MTYRNLGESYDVVTFSSGSRKPVVFSRVVPRPVSNRWLEPVATEYSYRTLCSESYTDFFTTRPNIYDSYYYTLHGAYASAFSTPIDVRAIKRRELRRYKRRHRSQFDEEEEDSSDEDR